jgi:hypothetical protein
MIRTTPRRLITLQCSHMGLTLLLTFMTLAPVRFWQSLEV